MGEVTNEAPTVLLADVDVLIDYCESDLEILKDVGRRIGRLAVLQRCWTKSATSRGGSARTYRGDRPLKLIPW